MRSARKLLMCLLAVVALVVSACSSTTVVANESRSPTTNTGASNTGESAQPDAGSGGGTEWLVESDSDAENFGLGGADQIERLITDCEAGSDLACDVLFQLSEFGTDEETTALQCGGRGPGEGRFCTDGMVSDGDELYFDEDSEGLDRVTELCVEERNLTACDFLFYRSPVGSESEEVGATCGGRVDVALPDCRTFFNELS